MKTFLFLTLCLSLFQFWNTSQFMKIYIQHNLPLQVLFLLSPRNKLRVCAWVHGVKDRSVVVCDFFWSVISVLIFLSGVVMFCHFLRKWLKEQGAWHKVLLFPAGLTVQNITKIPNSIHSICKALPFTSSCLFCVYQYFQLSCTIFFNT